eukprot:4702-Heterococcus_DN1.PRE.9
MAQNEAHSILVGTFSNTIPTQNAGERPKRAGSSGSCGRGSSIYTEASVSTVAANHKLSTSLCVIMCHRSAVATQLPLAPAGISHCVWTLIPYDSAQATCISDQGTVNSGALYNACTALRFRLHTSDTYMMRDSCDAGQDTGLARMQASDATTMYGHACVAYECQAVEQ